MAIKNIKDNLKRLKDADPVELAGQVNSWLQESGEALRLRIEDEVEKAVTKRGFVKRSEFSKLESRISQLELQLELRLESRLEGKSHSSKSKKSKNVKSAKAKGRVTVKKIKGKENKGAKR